MNTVSKIVSDETLNAIIQIESSGNPKIKASTSTALGLGQFLNKTWLDTVRKHAPHVMAGKSQAQILAMRLDPSFSIEMLARFTEDNMRIVGMNCTPGDLYLAHFLGAQTAKKLFQASPVAAVEPIVGSAAVRANRSILEGKSVKQVRDWAARKMAQKPAANWVQRYYKGVAVQPIASLPMRDDLPEGFHGNVELYDLQVQLAKMRYYTGELDGLWGGKTAGAISGFLNDRSAGIAAPTSLLAYEQSRATIKKLADEAEATHFVRPVNEARETADPKVIAKLAPEIVPTKQNFLTSAFAAIGGFLLTVWQLLGSYASAAWNFFTANKDNIPSSVTDPNFLVGFLHKVPTGLWFFLITIGMSFIAFNAWKASRKITEDVQSGAR